MTSRRMRRERRENSAAGLLRQIREDHWMTGPDAATSVEDVRPTFTCPDCRRTSHHPQDVEHAYCGHCKQFKCEQWLTPRCMEPGCPDFGSYDFGEGTCPTEHALPPAWRQRTC